jgi:EamA domain-containing membrane protein RarD
MSNPDAKPIAIFALAQLGIIFLGILAAGVTSKILRDSTGMEPPSITLFVLNRGILLCSIPLVWAAVTAHVRNNTPNPGIKDTVLLIAGPIIAVVLAVFMAGATLLQLCASHGMGP